MHLLAVTDPLVAPTWWLAIATIVLAIGAIVTAVLAYLAFRKQAAELVLLQGQAKDDREDRRREAKDRRRERASLVYLATSFRKGITNSANVSLDPVARARIHNTGRQPVYDARVHWVDRDTGVQAGAADVVGNIPPGDERGSERDLPFGTEELRLIPVAYFRDAAGIPWTLLDNGELDEADPTYPSGAGIIAESAVARARNRSDRAARLTAVITALEDNDLAAAQRALDLRRPLVSE